MGDWGKRWTCLAHFLLVIFGVIICFGARLTFCEQLATWLVPRQGSQGSNVRVIFVFSLTLEAVSLTFEPYLKIQKKAQIFSLTLEPFSKTSLTFEGDQSFSLTFEPDSQNCARKRLPRAVIFATCSCCPEFVVASARPFTPCGLGPTFHPRSAVHTVEQALCTVSCRI